MEYMNTAPVDEPRWLTDEEQRTWRAYVQATTLLEDHLDRQLQRDAGMPHVYYGLLVKLAEAPGRRLRMTELGEQAVLSREQISRVVTELERAGLVERTPNPDDKRSSYATITPAGRTRLREAAPTYLAAIERHYTRHLTDSEIRTLVRALGKVLAAEEPGRPRHG